MADDTRSRFFNRSPQKVDVQGFLTGLVDSSPEVQDMRKALGEADREITTKDQRISVLENELHRISRARDEWMAVAQEMQVQLEVIASVSAQACEASTNASITLANQAKNSLQAAKERLARSGMALPVASIRTTDVSDEATRKIGEIFGANSRRSNDPIQPETEQR